ncbi:MAG: phage major capsid protein [Oleispira sp.]|nr:phage major capsid protein [Oleispira sp.]
MAVEKEKLDALIEKMDARVGEATGKLKTEIEGLIKELKDASATGEVVTALEKRVSDMEIEAAKASKTIVESTKTVTFAEALKTAFAENDAKIKEVASGENQKGFKMELKAVGNISSAAISGGDIPQADRLDGFNRNPSRTVRLMNIMSSRSTSADKVEWVYQGTSEGAAGQTAEGALKNQIDLEWIVGSEVVKKTTAFIKVTEEMLSKGSIVSQEINNELVQEVLKAIEQTLYDGDGTGLNLRGITTVASAFAASTAGSTAIVNANVVDVLATAMTQIEIAQEGNALANAILMHPTDVLALKLEKLSATDKRYVGRLMESGQFLTVDGVPIIKSTLVPVGTYLIGDFSKSELVQREGMKIEIGYDGDDFTKNNRTIRCEWRGCLVVRNNNRSAFVTGVFATDTAALESLA